MGCNETKNDKNPSELKLKEVFEDSLLRYPWKVPYSPAGVLPQQPVKEDLNAVFDYNSQMVGFSKIIFK